MSDKLEEVLEKIKMYAGIIFIMLVISDAMLIAYVYQKNGMIFGDDTVLNNTVLGLLIATAVCFILFLVLCIVLRIQQGSMYVSIGDFLETIVILLFPVDTKSKKEISRMLDEIGGKEEITSTDLWKETSKGINIWNLVKSIFLFAFGSAILYTVIKSWIDLDDQRILMTVLGVLFIVILYFWGIVCGLGVKKRPDYLLDYASSHDLMFDTLNRDFTQAIRYDSQIRMGAEYVFINTGKGMQVVALGDVTECKVLKMRGWSSRRLFVSYYVLHVATENEHVMKYGINPISFYKLKDAIGK